MNRRSQPKHSSTVPISPDARAARTAEIGAEQGASPSNTAPYNSKEAENKEDWPFFQALRWGIDSLYVSYKGKLTLETEIILKRLKDLAQSRTPSDAAIAQIKIGD